MPTTTSHIPTQWTTEGFMQRFEELLPDSRTYLEAYNATEKEHKGACGSERYRNYESFRQARRNALLK